MRRDSHTDFCRMLTATVVAVTGLVGLLLFKNETMIQYGTTPGAAAAAGAAVTPTEQKQELEPVVPGPKPVQPAIPDQKKS